MKPLGSFKDCFTYLSTLNSVVECGVGDGRKIKDIHSPIKIGVDAFQPCLDKAQLVDKTFTPICHDLTLGLLNTLFAEKTIDAVCFFDVIEHFEKQFAFDLLNQAEKVAIKAVVLFIPVGNHPQTNDDRKLGNDYYQTHRSTWYPQEMIDLGYQVIFHENFHKSVGKDPGAMFCAKYL